MPAMNEAAQVGKLQEIGNWITNIQPDETPGLSLLSSGGRPNASLMTNQAEKYDNFGFKGSKDGAPVTGANTQNRDLISSAVQQFDFPWAVSERADITNVASVGRNEAGRQAVIAMLQIRRMKERAYFSNMVAAAESGSDYWTTWGIFAALDPTLSATGSYPIPANVRAVSGQVIGGASNSLATVLTEAATRSAFSVCFKQKKARLKLTGLVGIDAKHIFDDFTSVLKTSSSTSQPRTIFRVEGNNIYMNQVDEIRFSEGTATLVPSTYLLCDPATGNDTAFTHRSGVFFDTSLWNDAQMLPMSPRRLPDDGSGERGYVRTFSGLRPRSCLGQFYFAADSD